MMIPTGMLQLKPTAVFQDLEGDENGLCTATNANVCGEQGFAETLRRVVLLSSVSMNRNSFNLPQICIDSDSESGFSWLRDVEGDLGYTVVHHSSLEWRCS